MRTLVTATMIATALCCGALAWAQPAPGADDDLALLRDFVEGDAAYDAEERARALARLDELDARAGSLSRNGIRLAAAELAAMADNGHTFMIPGFLLPDNPTFPYVLHVFQGRVHVIGAPGDAELLGAELLTIDGVSVGELRSAYTRFQGGEQAFRDQHLPHFLASPAILMEAGLINEPRPVLTLRIRNGDIVERRPDLSVAPGPGGFMRSRLLRATAPSAVPLYLSQPQGDFLVAGLPELEAVYVAMRATRDGSEPIATFLQQAESEIRRVRPRNVIIDLRLNSGGDLNTARAFMQALPGLIPPDGRVYALISGQTFSAAISSLGYLEQAGGDQVIIVGEPVGDRLEFWAEGGVTELPYSGALVLQATERHNYMTGCPEEDCHGSIRRNPIRVDDVTPDVAAPLTVEAWLEGRDPGLEAISVWIAEHP